MAWDTQRLQTAVDSEAARIAPRYAIEALRSIGPVGHRHINFRGTYRCHVERYAERLAQSAAQTHSCRIAAEKPLLLAWNVRDPPLPSTFGTAGKLQIGRPMANHESARTTGLYDRRDDQVSLDEVERILI